ncbi:hypothetical protein SMICM17S_01668 [Streptomyces microflavus]
MAQLPVTFTVTGSTGTLFDGGRKTVTVLSKADGTATAPALKAGEKSGDFTVTATAGTTRPRTLTYAASVTARQADVIVRTDSKALVAAPGEKFADAVTLKATSKGAAAAVAHGSSRRSAWPASIRPRSERRRALELRLQPRPGLRRQRLVRDVRPRRAQHLVQERQTQPELLTVPGPPQQPEPLRRSPSTRAPRTSSGSGCFSGRTDSSTAPTRSTDRATTSPSTQRTSSPRTRRCPAARSAVGSSTTAASRTRAEAAWEGRSATATASQGALRSRDPSRSSCGPYTMRKAPSPRARATRSGNASAATSPTTASSERLSPEPAPSTWDDSRRTSCFHRAAYPS